MRTRCLGRPRSSREWPTRLPHPFRDKDRAAGRYELSILQPEFSLRQVPDRPAGGRMREFRGAIDLPEESALPHRTGIKILGNANQRPVLGPVALPFQLLDFGTGQGAKRHFAEGQCKSSIAADGGNVTQESGVPDGGMHAGHNIDGSVQGPLLSRIPWYMAINWDPSRSRLNRSTAVCRACSPSR